MTPNVILLDTEFTSIDQPRLISLGLVAAGGGGEFYLELADSWTLGECTLFVLGQVLPLLDEGDAAIVLRKRLGDLFELVCWLTAETIDERKKLLATAALQQALIREMPLALQWEEDTGLADLRIADVPRLADALKGLQLTELIRGSAARRRRAAARELAAWLSAFAGPLRLVADSPLDHQLILSLLRTSGNFPQQIEFRLPPLLIPEANLATRRRVQEAKTAFYAEGGRRHHALDDARALARWYEEAERLGALHPYGS
jgi:hypothetical protein